VLDEDVLAVLHQGSFPVAMDIHPTILVLHAKVGDFNIFELDLSRLLGLNGLKLHEIAPVQVVQLNAFVHPRYGGLSCLQDLCLPICVGLFLVLSCCLGRVRPERL